MRKREGKKRKKENNNRVPSKANQDIRQAAINKGVKHWQIADQMEIREDTLSRILRKELPEEDKKNIMEIIEKIALRGGEE